MKKTKKLVAILLMAVMMLGVAGTAMADNSSMWEPDDEYKLSWASAYVYSNAKIAAGSGSISKVTDKKVLTSAFDQTGAVDDFIFEKLRLETKNEKYIYICETILFDVQGITSGEVTVQLQDEGAFKAANYKKCLAVVSHYNVTTGKWEQMDKLAEIDENGCVTFKFNSYSPIMISIMNVKSEDLKEGSAYANVQKVTMTPQQVVAGAATKSPKMGE